jgi:hypothetical protein
VLVQSVISAPIALVVIPAMRIPCFCFCVWPLNTSAHFKSAVSPAVTPLVNQVKIYWKRLTQFRVTGVARRYCSSVSPAVTPLDRPGIPGP